jgi:hypothetical protein
MRGQPQPPQSARREAETQQLSPAASKAAKPCPPSTLAKPSKYLSDVYLDKVWIRSGIRLRLWSRLPCQATYASRDPAQLIVHVSIGGTPVHHLHGEPILVKPSQHLCARRAVHALIGNLGNPSAQLGIEIGETGRFSSQQSVQKITPANFTPDSIFPFVCAR